MVATVAEAKKESLCFDVLICVDKHIHELSVPTHLYTNSIFTSFLFLPTSIRIPEPASEQFKYDMRMA